MSITIRRPSNVFIARGTSYVGRSVEVLSPKIDKAPRSPAGGEGGNGAGGQVVGRLDSQTSYHRSGGQHAAPRLWTLSLVNGRGI